MKSIKQVKDDFKDNGVNISRWAIEHGFTPAVVFDLLAGRTKGSRGQAFDAAVKLGLKSKPNARSMKQAA